MRFRFVVPVAVVLAVAALGGCGSSSGDQPGRSAASSAKESPSAAADADAAETPPKRVDKSVTVNGVSDTGVITLLTVGTTTKYDHDGLPPESGQFIVCQVEVKGTKGEYPVNPLYLKVKLPDGKELDYGDGNALYSPVKPQLESDKDLKPGETMTGYIVFDAKLVPGTKLVVLDVSDDVAGEIPLA